MTNKRIKFDWSSLNRYGLAGYIWILYSDLVDQKISVTTFHNKIVSHLKKSIPLKFKKNINPQIENNSIHIGGCYWGDLDQQKKKPIELIFEYKHKRAKICLTSKRFWEICLSISDTLLHEVIHMRQYRRRKFKILPDYQSTAEKTELRQEQAYLGCSDEIDAYGFNIACELMDKYRGNKQRVIDYLNENQRKKKRKNNSWRMYLKAFEHDHNHVIIRRLKKKVVRYLSAAEYGKPYRNRDWISN
jgi:hypothetical protein